MEPLTNHQLSVIVDELQTGMKCYRHRQTGELIAFPNPDQFVDIDGWKEEIDQIDAHPDDYWEIIPMTSRKYFQLMEAFIITLPSQPFRNRLQHALD